MGIYSGGLIIGKNFVTTDFWGLIFGRAYFVLLPFFGGGGYYRNFTVLYKFLDSSDNSGLRIDVVVQFYPWFNFYFPLFYTH